MQFPSRAPLARILCGRDIYICLVAVSSLQSRRPAPGFRKASTLTLWKPRTAGGMRWQSAAGQAHVVEREPCTPLNSIELPTAPSSLRPCRLIHSPFSSDPSWIQKSRRSPLPTFRWSSRTRASTACFRAILPRQIATGQVLYCGKPWSSSPGPHTYVSPTLYVEPLSVPTWNYIAVHACGTLELIEDEPGKEGVLSALIAAHEPAYLEKWQSMPEEFRRSMLAAIVGFRIPITRIEGKFKLSQNRLEAERRNVQSAHAAGTAGQQELAAWMARLIG